MWPWSLFLLGAYHGLNPAMGWLFAVALGLLEKTGKAVAKSLLPLGLGHLFSVGAVIAVAQAAQLTLPIRAVRILAGLVLIAFGLYRLIRRRHPRWVGMRVNSRELTLWSFLMASAHGAGLMLLPFVMAGPQPSMGPEHAHHAMMVSGMQMGMTAQWWIPIGTHTVGYLLATALLALVVYYKVGIAVLRRGWLNLEPLWIGALLLAGILTLVM